MKYSDIIRNTLTDISIDPTIIHIGYNLKWGNSITPMLAGVKEEQIIEMPVAENLMVGVAIGMAIKGFKPIVHFERMDFLTNAMDAIVNHLDKIKTISHDEFNPAIIIRCVVGNKKKPLYTGLTHTQDFTLAMLELVNFPVIQLIERKLIDTTYKFAIRELRMRSSMLVEYKDLYDNE